MKMKLAISMFLVLSNIGYAQPETSAEDLVGIWYRVTLDDQVDMSGSLVIQKVSGSISVTLKDHKKTFSGILVPSKDGIGYESLLGTLGLVSFSVGESVSPMRSGSLSLDQMNEFESIDLGFFQRKTTLEKVLGRRL